MSVWTWLWVAWGLMFAVIEGVALFNSTRGDTLSEHAWAWLGVGRYRKTAQCATCGGGMRRDGQRWVHNRDHDSMHIHICMKADPAIVTPKWTLRVARIVLISGMVWLILHFTTGGWV